jgi:hypothetical protein
MDESDPIKLKYTKLLPYRHVVLQLKIHFK